MTINSTKHNKIVEKKLEESNAQLVERAKESDKQSHVIAKLKDILADRNETINTLSIGKTNLETKLKSVKIISVELYETIQLLSNELMVTEEDTNKTKAS